MNEALAGLKVLDLSRVLAGPYCTQMLSDLGAEIWKLESPLGDDTRRWGPPFVRGESSYFLSANRGKESLGVDLKIPEGRHLVVELARRADVLVENFKSGDLARYGLSYAELATVNPRLIYASITGFGHSGPRASEPGYDAALQGITGIMSLTGAADGPPTKVGVAWIDVLTGLTAAVGILAALRERETSGIGQHLDLALFDVGAAALVNQAQAFLLVGEVPQRMGNAHPQIVPYQAFEAADGWFMLAVGNDAQYRRLTGVLGECGSCIEEQFSTNAGRVKHREVLVPILAKLFGTRPRAYWLELLHKATVPASPVNTVNEVFADPQARARELVWPVEHPTLDALPTLASPLAHMSRTPATPHGAPPLLSQHTRLVLARELGLSDSELDGLEQVGAIVRPPT